MMPLNKIYNDNVLINKSNELSDEISTPYKRGLNIPGLRTFDNVGDIVYYDLFNDTTLHWGEVNLAALTTSYAYSGDSSLALRFTGEHSHPYVRKLMRNITGGTIGIEVRFSFDDISVVDDLGVGLLLYTGTQEKEFGIYLEPIDRVVKYWGQHGSINNIAISNWVAGTGAWGTDSDPNMWHALKVVYDLDNNEYLRLMCDEFYVDMTGTSGFVGKATYPSVESLVFIDAHNIFGGVGNIYIDSLILTNNEPRIYR